MGMQGPLAAQALGRSPYDEVVDGEGEHDSRQPTQQYDHRGRPVNPDTKRMNRDIIRAHNEVMLVIGVAEAENPFSGPEADSQRRHEAHEEAIGLRLGSSARTCVEAVGIFGVHGLRQRILIYKRYSHIPFWDFFKQARPGPSFYRDLFAGAPTSWLAHYLELEVAKLWQDGSKQVTRHIVHELWSYLKVLLELHVTLQRVGLTSNKFWLPHPSFFIPFTESSPIPAPPPLQDYTIPSLLGWLGGAIISSTPFLVWVMSQRLLRDWRSQIWSHIYQRLPNTIFHRKKLPPAAPPPPPPPPPPAPLMPSSIGLSSGFSGIDNDVVQREFDSLNQRPSRQTDETAIETPSGQETLRRGSVFSARGEEYPSDDEENEGVSTTLISFDVEASESQDAPPGLWSAELRPSAGPESRSNGTSQPVYIDTLLTHLPPLIASHLFTDSITRILMAPYEATALRLVARATRLRQGLPCGDIFNVNMLSGATGTSVVNFFATELLHIVIASDVWAVFTYITQWYHVSEEEWKEQDDQKAH